jgi:hypothetical protein
LSISTTDAATPFSINFGLWYHQAVSSTADGGIIASSTCTLYPPDQPVDSAWIAARVFNLIAIILGAAILVFDGCSGCISTNPKKAFRGGALGYLMVAFSSGMSLILLNTNICSSNHNSTLAKLNVDFSSCVVSTGGKSAIVSIVFWLAAAVGTALLHPSHRLMRKVNDNGLDEPLIKTYEEDALIKGSAVSETDNDSV